MSQGNAEEDLYEFGEDELAGNGGEDSGVEVVALKMQEMKKKVNVITDVIGQVETAMLKNLQMIKKCVDPKKCAAIKNNLSDLTYLAQNGWQNFQSPAQTPMKMISGDQSLEKKRMPVRNSTTGIATTIDSKDEGRRESQASKLQLQLTKSSVKKQDSRGKNYLASEDDIDDLLEEFDV